MNLVKKQYESDRAKALAWLNDLKPHNDLGEVVEDYSSGALFTSPIPEPVFEFLDCCVELESAIHLEDKELVNVVMSVDFEFWDDSLKLAFTFTQPETPGSISFAVSVYKSTKGQFLVYGAEQFRGCQLNT